MDANTIIDYVIAVIQTTVGVIIMVLRIGQVNMIVTFLVTIVAQDIIIIVDTAILYLLSFTIPVVEVAIISLLHLIAQL